MAAPVSLQLGCHCEECAMGNTTYYSNNKIPPKKWDERALIYRPYSTLNYTFSPRIYIILYSYPLSFPMTLGAMSGLKSTTSGSGPRPRISLFRAFRTKTSLGWDSEFLYLSSPVEAIQANPLKVKYSCQTMTSSKSRYEESSLWTLRKAQSEMRPT